MLKKKGISCKEEQQHQGKEQAANCVMSLL